MNEFSASSDNGNGIGWRWHFRLPTSDDSSKHSDLASDSFVLVLLSAASELFEATRHTINTNIHTIHNQGHPYFTAIKNSLFPKTTFSSRILLSEYSILLEMHIFGETSGACGKFAYFV